MSEVIDACIFVDRIRKVFAFVPVYLVSGVNLQVSTCLSVKLMRKQTEADPCVHTPERSRLSSCPSQYCEPSSPHHRFPVQNTEYGHRVSGLQ